MSWLGGTKIFVCDKQVAEILKQHHASDYIIRNARPNGTVGVCFSSVVKKDITDWLDNNYPGWTKGLPNAARVQPVQEGSKNNS